MNFTFELVGYVFIVVLGIVPIANPFSTAPVLISLTPTATDSARKRLATRACIYMAGLLVVFLLLGALILQFFGITIQSLRIAGGLVVAYLGFRMLFPPPEKKAAVSDGGEEQDPLQLAFVPMAMPMLSGPGSISVVLGMATQIAQYDDFATRVTGYAVVAVGILISAFICWTVLWSAGAIVRFLGKGGIEAATKLMGFLLICMGTQFVLTGLAMT